MCAPGAGELRLTRREHGWQSPSVAGTEVFQEKMMTLSRRWVRGAVWVVLVMAGSLLGRGQEVSGSISGTVLDASGAVVNGAVVTITNTDRGFVERTVKTDKAGFYTASSLPLGNYSVSVA